MAVIYVLLPIAILLAAAALAAFVRAVRSGQFDDLETPPWRLFTEGSEEAPPAEEGEEPPLPRGEDPPRR